MIAAIVAADATHLPGRGFLCEGRIDYGDQKGSEEVIR